VFTGTLWQATSVQELLEDNEIQAFLENELMSTIAPWTTTPGGGLNTVKVKTSDLVYDMAIKLIEENKHLVL
jgi:hypothetical protein